jgi:hypothetical protein
LENSINKENNVKTSSSKNIWNDDEEDEKFEEVPVIVTQPDPVIVTQPNPIVVTQPDPIVVTQPKHNTVTQPKPNIKKAPSPKKNPSTAKKLLWDEEEVEF